MWMLVWNLLGPCVIRTRLVVDSSGMQMARVVKIARIAVSEK